MQDSDFSDDFCSFIQRTVPTLEAAELVMTLAAEPDSWWSVADLAAQLRPALMLNDAEMARYLNTFQKSGLIVTDADRRVHFQPDTEPLARHVDTLAQAYRERPVTLIRMIYALRDAKIRSFADAFKLRGK